MAAALGLRRDESEALARLAQLRFGVRVEREGQLLVDYHIAKTQREKNPYVTYRHYLQDAVFLAGIESEDTALLQQLQDALQQVLGVPLGLRVISREGSAAAAPEPDAGPIEGNGYPAGDEEYTFANFVVGSSNKFAHAASQAVASQPAGLYNPLFIYGGSGLGKTHLLCAICKEIQKRDPRAHILYTKGETMTNELNAMAAILEPEMTMHFNRWAEENDKAINFDSPTTPEGALRYWNTRLNFTRNVLKKRPTYFYEMVQERFNLSDEQMLNYFGVKPELPSDAIVTEGKKWG